MVRVARQAFVRCAACVVIASAGVVRAEEAVVPVPGVSASPVAPPPVEPPKPPAPPFPLRFTGILHSMAVVSQGTQSFDNVNFSAPTSAANPALLADPSQVRVGFEAQQTRFGLLLGEGTALKGVLELDFIHFDQAAPTTQAYPRMRQAFVEYTFAEGQKVFLGQTWDVFGNSTNSLLSHSFNLVGTMFRAGNVGFMRHQFGWSGRFGQWDVAAALGMPGANATPVFGNVEDGLVPTGAVRVMWLFAEKAMVGVSAVATPLRFTKAGSPAESRLAGGAQVFADLTLDAWNVHAEAYAGRNLANVGALALSYGRWGQDVSDVGGYVSAKYTLGMHAFTLMAGAAWVPDASAVVPGYTAPAAGATVGAPASTSGPGIERNWSAHAGWWVSPMKGLSFVVEPYVYRTRFKLLPADAAVVQAEQVALGGLVGAMFQF